MTPVAAQTRAVALPSNVRVGGNIYGGGNKGPVQGNTTVHVTEGSLNHVFGGARMANVGGRSFVNIDGEHATDEIFITSVFGGNDISGTVGLTAASTVPEELTDIKRIPADATDSTKNVIDDTWKTFVRTSPSTTIEDEQVVDNHGIVIGTLYGGGNGDYTYTDAEGNDLTDGAGNYIVKDGDDIIATSPTRFNKPEVAKAYLEIKGGCIAHLYGGGNNATVTENTTISINNESGDLESWMTRYALNTGTSVATIFASLQSLAKLNTFQSDLSRLNFNFARVFGGNNRADMAIRPTWNLQKGIIRDLYSGGNEGRMTSPEGLLLEIQPTWANKDKLSAVNVYGGCRRADVRPLNDLGVDVTSENLEGYNFPIGLSARTLVRGGRITNVYGGNDISGTVYGGNAVGIYTTVYGNVYGGGNGSYAYTDNAALQDSEFARDFYYNPTDVIAKHSLTPALGMESLTALNAFRPNAEQVSIRLKGTDAAHPTIIHGSVFVGGNSASLDTKKSLPMVELKIGSHVIADQTYLGNNGEKMVDPDVLELYAKSVDEDGTVGDSGTDYSSLDLTNAAQFATYMDGVAMNLQPDVLFDGDALSDRDVYDEFTSYVGSFFCGGNVGSMAVAGKNIYDFDHGLKAETDWNEWVSIPDEFE